MNKEKVDKLIARQKKACAALGFEKQKVKIGYVGKMAKEASLVVAGFKCEKCGVKEKLQCHHLIMRRAKEFTDFYRYATQRYYWANIIVLCEKCHGKYHGVIGGDDDMGFIEPETIEKLKIKYEYNE